MEVGVVSRTAKYAETGRGAPDAAPGLPRNVTRPPERVTIFGNAAGGAMGSPAKAGTQQVARCVPDSAPVMRRRLGARGFTLVELMIVVAMIGVMAALAIVGYRKYLHSAQGSEAKSTIQMIRGAEEAYKSEMLQYLKVSSTITTYYPNTTPNDHRFAWVQPGHSDYLTGWKLLAVNPDGPVRFGYACIAGVATTDSMQALSDFANPPTLPALANGTAWYEIQAKNDHDGNGKFAVYASTSLSGEILSENETE